MSGTHGRSQHASCHCSGGYTKLPDDQETAESGEWNRPTGSTLVGDLYSLSGCLRGGNDRLRGGDYAGDLLIGDAFVMSAYARGGDDVLQGGQMRGQFTTMIGDAQEMQAHTKGGNDLLIGGAGGVGLGVNFLYGDAETLRSGARGGDDVLVAGPGATTLMWGDARVKEPGACGGRDIFDVSSGNSNIQDFEPGKDRIDVSGMGARSLEDLGLHSAPAELSSSALAAQGVGFGHVFVEHVTSLSAADFIFA